MQNISVETYKFWEILPHLNLSPFHNRPIQLFSCSVSLARTLEGDEPKALQVHTVILCVYILFLVIKNSVLELIIFL